jgi:hypothetical protein
MRPDSTACSLAGEKGKSLQITASTVDVTSRRFLMASGWDFGKSGSDMFRAKNRIQPSVLILSVAAASLTTLQVAPPSLPPSVAQVAVTGALLVWFVGFALKQA